jgi:hypothetical protein
MPQLRLIWLVWVQTIEGCLLISVNS